MLSSKTGTSTSPVMFAWLAFALLLLAFNQIFHPLLIQPTGQMGGDYSLGLSAWLDGYFWFRNNGLEPPWFTPSFCAGQPFFADPQSFYYSLPQLVAILVGPGAAANVTLLGTASLMYWGGYLLMRKIFMLEVSFAILVGGLLMFNGFLPHRMLIGHITFHGFALVPWIALLLLLPVPSRVNQLAAAAGAGLMIAYWVQSGLASQILIGGFAVLLVAFLYFLQNGPVERFLARGSLAAVFAMCLSAAKLLAALSYLSHFPRNDYLLPGAANVFEGTALIAGSLFLPSQWAHSLGAPFLVNMQWTQEVHEWAYGFGIVTALLLVLLLLDSLRRVNLPLRFNRRHFILLLLLILCLAWPLAFCVYTPTWNAFLKSVPVLNTASTPLRWIFAYVPFLAVAIGMLLQRAKWGKFTHYAAFICLIGTVALAAFEPDDYYRAQRTYDAEPIAAIDQLVRAEAYHPAIHWVGVSANAKIDGKNRELTGNNTFAAGVSQALCYNPVFGYRLEKFSPAGLTADTVFAEHDGHLNLKNPACYVYPKENNCQPGDLFRADQLEQAKAFVEYRPFSFQVSDGQKVASLVTEWTLGLLALGIIAWVGYLLAALRRRT